jgi:hypothetical protein
MTNHPTLDTTPAVRWAKQASPDGYIAQAFAVAREPELHTADDRAKASRILRAQRLILDAIKLEEYKP